MKKQRKRFDVKIMVIMLLVLLFAFGCAAKEPDIKPAPSALEQTHEFETAVEKLSECYADISSRSQMIFRRDKEIPINSDPKSYKIIILDGIKTCEKWETALTSIGHSEDTNALIKITRQYISNQKVFFKYLLTYVEKRKPDDLELSNKYSRLAAEDTKVYTPALVSILEKNHYIYELKDGYVHFESKLQQ